MSRDKRLERERRSRARQWRALFRVALLAVAVAAVLGAGVWFYRSPVFSIDTVEVVGVTNLSADAVRTIAAVPPEATLVRFPAKQIEERLRKEPWIAEVEIDRSWPHTLRIEVTERAPVAVLDTGGASLWMIDAEANVLGEPSAEDTAPAVVIRDVPELKPEAGKRLRSEPLDNALAVLGGLSEELRSQVRAISAASVDKTALYTRDNVEIFVGSSDSLSQKDQVTRHILEEQAGKVVYINVRTVDRPTWRGLESDTE